MDPLAAVGGEETVLRHIPGGVTWQAPPDGRASSVNFRLRAGESGLSVSRDGLCSPAALIARLGDPQKGSRIAAASVAAIRSMGLEVVPAPLDEDPGHAEIRSAAAVLTQKDVQRRLSRHFQYVI